MANDLVCIDSMICVWGIKKEATEGQEHMIHKSEMFLSWLDEEKKKIILPSPILTEILMPIEDEHKRNEITEMINSKFIVSPFDAIASIEASKIWNENDKKWREIYIRGTTILRDRFKFDTMILAIAITKNVDILYTNDRKFTSIASNYINTQPVPDIPYQGKLFEDEKK